MRYHGSIGLFREWCFWWEIWIRVFWPFPFLFLFSAGRQSHQCTGFWLAIKGRGPLQVVVSFLSLLACDNFVFFRYCLVQRSFCIFLSFSSDLWSGIFLLFFFCFLSIFDRELSFFFCFIPIFDQELSFFTFLVFFRGQGWTFSPWVKVYSELGSWLKACRMDGHDIC